ncbi:MAG: hypothetical protein KF842_06865 [Caulobacter sp.]|nr:hypothetical protein [Caulobacter sp.]
MWSLRDLDRLKVRSRRKGARFSLMDLAVEFGVSTLDIDIALFALAGRTPLEALERMERLS